MYCKTNYVLKRCVFLADSHSVKYQIGCGHPSPQITLSRLIRAVQLWPTAYAYQIVLPDWFVVTNVEATVFLQRLVAVTDKLILYNPGNAKR